MGVVGESFARRYVDSMLGKKKNILIELYSFNGIFFFSYASVTCSTSDYSTIGQSLDYW